MWYPSSSNTHTHGPPCTLHCERHIGRSSPQANALTLVLKKNIRRLEELRPATRCPEGICCGRRRAYATCRDIRRLEEICPDTLRLEEKVPWHSSSGMQMLWQALSRRHMPWLVVRKTYDLAGVVTSHVMTFAVWKKYALTLCVWKGKYPGTCSPEGICCSRYRTDATRHDIRRLEEICPDTLPLEAQIPRHSSCARHMQWHASSGCHIP